MVEAVAKRRDRVVKRHRDRLYERESNDWYIEPAFCWQRLFELVSFRGGLLDPAAGRGTSLEVARAFGYRAFGTDLVQRAPAILGGFDFLDPDYRLMAPFWTPNIISNPPYNEQTVPFIRQALRLASYRVAMLVQSPFLYSQGRYELFTSTPVSHVIHFSRRPSMPPGDLLVDGLIKAKGGKEDYCIVVWTKGWRVDPATLWAKP